MKVYVWVTVGKPSESIFLETNSVEVDLPTDGKDDLRTIVFELPLGARLDGRGPIRVMLEPQKQAGQEVRCPGCGRLLILTAEGDWPEHTTRAGGNGVCVRSQSSANAVWL